MEKLIGVLAVLASVLTGCGDATFTAEPPLFTDAGFAGGGAAGASTGQAGAAVALAGSAGAALAGDGGAGGAGAPPEPTAGSAGAPAVVTTPPCQGAIDAPSHGYLALQSDTCYRTPDVFNTVTCIGTGWADRTIHVNGALATCNAMSEFPPPIGGYTYIEIDGGEPGADILRWSESE